jgi:hypothetical protein
LYIIIIILMLIKITSLISITTTPILVLFIVKFRLRCLITLLIML